jgi:hypothetical protein
MMGALIVGLVLAQSGTADWRQVGTGVTGNLSGLAVEKGGTLLAVHDNKRPTEPRLSRIVDGKMTTLSWPTGGELPIDLEAISEIPGRDGEFLALASAGKVFHIAVDGDSVRLLGTSALPGAKPFLGNNYEGLRLANVRGETVAVWSHRGGSGRDGLVFVAPVSWDNGLRFGPGSVYRLRAPWPESDRRDASDIVIRPDGEVIVSAASDPGDDGPFSSTLYSLGSLTKNPFGVWELPVGVGRFARPTELPGWRNSRKIEALARTAGLIAGTDDENGGGWLR